MAEHGSHMAMHEKEECFNHKRWLTQREGPGLEMGILTIRWLTQRMYESPNKMCVLSKEASVMDVDYCSVVYGENDFIVIWFDLH